MWYGGRAPVLSAGGSSLSGLGIMMEFTSLELVERCDSLGFEESSAGFYVTDLFSLGGCLIHYFGVNQTEPRNVLQKGWCRLMIIDFAFSNVDHMSRVEGVR